MMFFTSPSAANRTFRPAQGGTATELAASINQILATIASPSYLLGIEFNGAGDGTQWGALLLTSTTLPAAVDTNYAFSGTPAVPAGAAYQTQALTCAIGQGGTVAEATAALAAQVLAPAVVRAMGVVGSSSGGQWIAWALVGA